MEFKSLKNIETSFRQIRLFTLVFASLCAVVTGFALWKSYSFAEAQRQKIYVLTLRSPGGCPWDIVQTHKSLRRNLIEEVYEVIEAKIGRASCRERV